MELVCPFGGVCRPGTSQLQTDRCLSPPKKHLEKGLTVQALVSIIHVWSRILSIKKILRSMPKPYIPTKQIDLPKVRTRSPSCL
jgi:hypothetical protein